MDDVFLRRNRWTQAWTRCEACALMESVHVRAGPLWTAELTRLHVSLRMVVTVACLPACTLGRCTLHAVPWHDASTNIT